MFTALAPRPIAEGPRRRHDTRVNRFSLEAVLLTELDGLAVDDHQARYVVEAVCGDFSVEVPRMRFHARRSPYTGATEQPRWLLVELHGIEDVRRIEERRGSSLPLKGAIRLGRVTTLMTVAHELGHHLVFCLDRPRTPGHGKRWVQRFDEAARAIRRIL